MSAYTVQMGSPVFAKKTVVSGTRCLTCFFCGISFLCFVQLDDAQLYGESQRQDSSTKVRTVSR